MTAPWFFQTLIGTLILIPGWLAITFFSRNFQVIPDLLIVWYFLGGSIGAAALGRTPMASLFPSFGIVVSLIAIGFIVCGYANLLIFRAVPVAPNQGLPVAISSVASVGVYFVSAGLAWMFPRMFDAVKINPASIFGTLLVISGVAIVAISK